MGCDYYIQTQLVIEYLDNLGRFSVIYTDRYIKKGYLFKCSDYDSDNICETEYQKCKSEIEQKIKENTYNKILFENNAWTKETYKNKFEQRLTKEFKEISNINKIYKKTTAWERE